MARAEGRYPLKETGPSWYEAHTRIIAALAEIKAIEWIVPKDCRTVLAGIGNADDSLHILRKRINEHLSGTGDSRGAVVRRLLR